MKRIKFESHLLFAFAIFSAFAYKSNLKSDNNGTGWFSFASNCLSGILDQPNCAVQSGTNCSISYDGIRYSPSYDTRSDCVIGIGILNHH